MCTIVRQTYVLHCEVVALTEQCHGSCSDSSVYMSLPYLANSVLSQISTHLQIAIMIDPVIRDMLITVGALLGTVVLLVVIYAIIRVKTHWIEKLWDLKMSNGDVEKANTPALPTEPYTLADRLRADIDRDAALDSDAALTVPAPARHAPQNHATAERVARLREQLRPT